MAKACEFADDRGRVWLVDVDTFTIERVQKDVGFNLGAVNDPAALDALYRDPVLFCKVLWSLCREQTERLRVSPEEFARQLKGDVLWAAVQAFEAALLLFIPNPTRRNVLRATLEKGRALEELATERALEQIEAATLESEPAATAPASNGAASSDSTPAPAG